MERDEILRTYGFLPEMAQPHAGPIRSRLTMGSIVGQWIAFAMVTVGFISAGVYFFASVPDPTVRFGAAGVCFALAAVSGFAIARDANEWVEIDGHTLRWQHLYSQRVHERDIGELEAVVTLTLPRQLGLTEVLTRRAVDGMFGRVKGFEFRFRGMKPGVRIWRADPAMTNVRQLLEAVVTGMCEHGDVAAETVDFEGTPLIRRLTAAR